MARWNDVSFFIGEEIDLVCTTAPVEDITGWTIVLTLRTVIAIATVLSLTAALTTPEDGVFTVSFSHAQTLALRGSYRYDISRTNTGAQAVLSIGSITVAPSVLYL